VIGVVVSLLNWILLALWALVSAAFRAPLVEAERQGEPRVKMSWQTRNRQVGPRVLERIAAALERGETPREVGDATFLGVDRPATPRSHRPGSEEVRNERCSCLVTRARREGGSTRRREGARRGPGRVRACRAGHADLRDLDQRGRQGRPLVRAVRGF